MAPAAPMTIRGAALRACAGPPPSAARGHLKSGSRRGVPCPRGNAVHSIATHRRVPGPRLVDRGPTAALLVATGITARADLATARASSSGDASGSSGGPLGVDTDLRLYRARKKCRDGDRERAKDRKRSLYKQSEELFRGVIASSPRNGRAYVGLAKVLERQHKIELAKKGCEDACAATKGENAHVRQAGGDRQRARQLFDAAIAADKTLISAYHPWAMLEQRGGNAAKARQLLVK